jgi:hypothetical protein
MAYVPHLPCQRPTVWPHLLAETNLAVVFYWLCWLLARGIPNLGVAFPMYDDKELVVAFPLALPMGWIESPPYVCTATKTVADLANAVLMNTYLPPHLLERMADILPPPNELTPTSSNTTLSHQPLPPVSHYTVPGTPEGPGSAPRHLYR